MPNKLAAQRIILRMASTRDIVAYGEDSQEITPELASAFSAEVHRLMGMPGSAADLPLQALWKAYALLKQKWLEQGHTEEDPESAEMAAVNKELHQLGKVLLRTVHNDEEKQKQLDELKKHKDTEIVQSLPEVMRGVLQELLIKRPLSLPERR
jgi:hypothetical protein